MMDKILYRFIFLAVPFRHYDIAPNYSDSLFQANVYRSVFTRNGVMNPRARGTTRLGWNRISGANERDDELTVADSVKISSTAVNCNSTVDTADLGALSRFYILHVHDFRFWRTILTNYRLKFFFSFLLLHIIVQLMITSLGGSRKLPYHLRRPSTTSIYSQDYK